MKNRPSTVKTHTMMVRIIAGICAALIAISALAMALPS